MLLKIKGAELELRMSITVFTTVISLDVNYDLTVKYIKL
jgi:hypothetical protein